MNAKVNEVFTSIQGEGKFTGHPAVFVRFQGCNRRCSFCDSPHTQKVLPQNEVSWKQLCSLEEHEEHWASVPVKTLTNYVVKMCKKEKISLVVLTGGEPFLQREALVYLADNIPGDIRVCIETNGTVEVDELVGSLLRNVFVFITVSPKEGVFEQYIREANQVKLLVDAQGRFDIPCSASFYGRREREYRVFQPIWTTSEDQNIRAALHAISAAKTHNGVVSLQTHKFIGMR